MTSLEECIASMDQELTAEQTHTEQLLSRVDELIRAAQEHVSAVNSKLEALKSEVANLRSCLAAIQAPPQAKVEADANTSSCEQSASLLMRVSTSMIAGGLTSLLVLTVAHYIK